MRLERRQIRELIHQSPETVVEIVMELSKQVDVLSKRVEELEKQMGMNSKNSHKPPTSDGMRKTKSQRQKGGKRGRPIGHRGETRMQSEIPDEVKEYKPEFCPHCAHELHSVEQTKVDKRQVIDIVFRQEITEHRRITGICPHCGDRVRGSFPQNVVAPVQYGDGIASLAVYLNAYQHLPIERTAELLGVLLGGNGPSIGTVAHMVNRAGEKAIPQLHIIRERILEADVIHVDETSLSAEGRRWLHVVDSKDYTYYGVHEKRGYDAIHDIGLLERYHGIMVHDFWSSYFKDQLPGTHAMCNAHLLRELEAIIDSKKGQAWAAKMQQFLRESWKEVKVARETSSGGLSDDRKSALTQEYGAILKSAEAELEKLKPPPSKRRRNAAKTDAENLWCRFVDYAEAILRFIHDPRVPFDNNSAERSLRMMKLKMKISGTFRSDKGAHVFAALRSFMSSAKKQGFDVCLAIRLLLSGQFAF